MEGDAVEAALTRSRGGGAAGQLPPLAPSLGLWDSVARRPLRMLLCRSTRPPDEPTATGTEEGDAAGSCDCGATRTRTTRWSGRRRRRHGPGHRSPAVEQPPTAGIGAPTAAGEPEAAGE